MNKLHIPFFENTRVGLFSFFAFFSLIIAGAPFLFRSLHQLTFFFGKTFFENKLFIQAFATQFSFQDIFRAFFDYTYFQAVSFRSLQYVMPDMVLLIVSFVFSALLGLLYLQIREKNDGRVIFTLLFSLLAPSFVMAFISLTPALFAIPCLLLLGISLEKKWDIFTFSLFLFLSFLSFESAVISFSMLVLYNFGRKANSTKYRFTLGIQLIIFCMLLGVHLFSYGLEFTHITTFFESGNIGGYTLYLFGFGLLGYFFSWSKRKKGVHLLNAVILIMSFFIEQFVVYATLILAYYGSKTIVKLFELDWKNAFLKVATLLLLYAILVSGYLFFIQAATLASPGLVETEFFREVAEKLHSLDEIETHILALERQKTHFAYFTKATIVVTENEDIYQSTDLPQTLEYLRDENIEYIYIDQQMRDGEIWLLDNTGLLLLVTNEELFQPIISTEFATLYWINYRFADE